MAVADLLHQSIYSGLERWGQIYGHEKSSGETLFGILKTFYDSIPSYKPDLVKNTEKKLWFEGGSKIDVKTIKGDGLSLGETPDYTIMTEVSSYQKAKEIREIINGLTMNPQLTFIQESTSKGYDDYWYESHLEFEDLVRFLSKKYAREITLPTREQEKSGITLALVLLKAGFWPKDKFFHVFIPWFWNNRNREKDINILTEVRETLTDYEKSMIENYDLEMEQVAWYRSRSNLVNNDDLALKQGYPCSVEESFISSGNCFFDVSKISTLVGKVEKLPNIVLIAQERGVTDDDLIKQLNTNKEFPRQAHITCDLYYKAGTEPKTNGGRWFTGRDKVKIEPIIDKMGRWIIFDPPEPNWVNRYLVAVDTAEAKAESDDDVVGVFDLHKDKFVALCYGHIGVDFLPEEIAKAASWYNFADALVERNGGSGQTVLSNLRYRYLHVIGIKRTNKIYDEISTSDLGLYWDMYNKDRAANYAKSFVESISLDGDGSELPFKEILQQMTYFMKNTLKADKRRRDDFVMMVLIALEGARAIRESGKVPKFLGDKNTQLKRAMTSHYEDIVPSQRCY